MSDQRKRRNPRGMVSDASDVVAVIDNGSNPIVVGAPRGFECAPLVELYIAGDVHNLTAEQAERIGEALIAASLKAGAPE
jgi:hypothetical protein